MSAQPTDHQTRGKFITIEGTEGVGKSTNIEFIQQWLSQQGIPFIATREPGGTALAEEVRSLLLSPRDETVNETAELLLMFAARAQHLHEKILPALAKGIWVLCDRFTDSTYAYQGEGRGLDKKMIEQLETLVQAEVQPDLTLYLDIDVRLGLERARGRGQLDRFEQEDIAFFERVRSGFNLRAQTHQNRFQIIDASPELAVVQQKISQVLENFVNRH